MAVVNQLNLNVGTEQNPNFVLHDLNDKRISTTAVTTATHLLTCNSGVTSIAPITAANLASVLGVWQHVGTLTESDDLNSKIVGSFVVTGSSGIPENAPTNKGFFLVCFGAGKVASYGLQIVFELTSNVNLNNVYYRTYGSSTYNKWCQINTTLLQ